MPPTVSDLPPLDDAWILAQRGPRNELQANRPYAWIVEKEFSAAGTLDDVATIFLNNKECPFRCLMCDLWKNTLPERTPEGAVGEQVEWALAQLPPAKHLKLYNAANFFDGQSIPRRDWTRIAESASAFETVIVECHPKLIGRRCVEFAEMIAPARLEVAMGLETVDPKVLPRLNKRMTLADFAKASGFLRDHDIAVRSFILIRAPFQTEAEGVTWAQRSIEFAFANGVGCCSVVPTRAGNGAMEWLADRGHFTPPTLRSMERVLDYGVGLGAGRVFLDLWDIEKFVACNECASPRVERLRQINETQQLPPAVRCACGT